MIPCAPMMMRCAFSAGAALGVICVKPAALAMIIGRSAMQITVPCPTNAGSRPDGGDLHRRQLQPHVHVSSRRILGGRPHGIAGSPIRKTAVAPAAASHRGPAMSWSHPDKPAIYSATATNSRRTGAATHRGKSTLPGIWVDSRHYVAEVKPFSSGSVMKPSECRHNSNPSSL